SRFAWFTHTEADWQRQQKRNQITLEQAKVIEREMTQALAVAPVVNMTLAVSYKNHSSASVQIIGTTDQFLLTSGFNVGRGRFLSASEASGGRPVCVIGTDVARNLFDREDPLGKQI